VDGHDQHLGQVGLKRELSHSTTETSQEPFVVESTKCVQHFKGVNHGLDRRCVHEVEVNKIVDPHSFELQNCCCEIGPLDFRHGSGKHGLGVVNFLLDKT